MSYVVKLDESNASRRVINIWSILSNGTSPAANEAGGQPTMSIGGVAAWNSAGTLRAMNAAAGEYFIVLGTSDVSVLGPGVIRYSSSSALETSVPLQIVAYDPYASLSTFDPSSTSVGLKAQTHSGATIDGVTRVNSSVTIANAEYSAVTVRTSVLSGHTPQTGDNFPRLGAPAGASVSADVAAVKVDTAAVKVKTDQLVFTTANRVDARIFSAVTLAGGTYSDVTVQINGIAPGAYSSVTIAGVTSGVTLLGGRYSNVTIGGAEKLESAVTLLGGRYSNVTIGGVEKVESAVTVGTGGIIAASFAAGSIDAVALATDAGQEIADRILQRNIMGGSDSGRTVSEALAILRNRVSVDGSTVTVYRENDTTSYWTASVATVSANSGIINSIDPG